MYHDLSMWKGAHPDVFSKARELRENMTETEKIMWELLNNDPFRKFKFRRQHPLGNYILDFYSHKLELSIEIDGEYHDKHEQKEYDRLRTEFIAFQGIQELRFKNHEVLNDLGEIKFRIQAHINSAFPGSLLLA